MLILQIAVGIVLGSLAVAFLKTSAGRYAVLAVVTGALSGGLWGAAVLFLLADAKHLDDWQRILFLLSIPSIALVGGWWLPRTVFLYRQSVAEVAERDRGWWLKRSADQAFGEAIWVPVVTAFFVALLAGPFAWGLGDATLRSWGRGGTLVAWGFVAIGVYMEIRSKRRAREIDAMLAAEKAATTR